MKRNGAVEGFMKASMKVGKGDKLVVTQGLYAGQVVTVLADYDSRVDFAILAESMGGEHYFTPEFVTPHVSSQGSPAIKFDSPIASDDELRLEVTLPPGMTISEGAARKLKEQALVKQRLQRGEELRARHSLNIQSLPRTQGKANAPFEYLSASTGADGFTETLRGAEVEVVWVDEAETLDGGALDVSSAMMWPWAATPDGLSDGYYAPREKAPCKCESLLAGHAKHCEWHPDHGRVLTDEERERMRLENVWGLLREQQPREPLSCKTTMDRVGGNAPRQTQKMVKLAEAYGMGHEGIKKLIGGKSNG